MRAFVVEAREDLQIAREVRSLLEQPDSGGAAMNALSDGELRLIDAYWRAANYLSVGQIYLLDNPLLREPLQPEHVKPRLLGHWGTTPGLELRLRAHEPRDPELGPRRDLRDRARARRPGGGRQRLPRRHLHRGLPGDHAGTRRGCGGCSGSSRSRAGSRPTWRRRRPGSIHEGGELGYALSHAYGAAFDNPDLLVCCVVGDGEAETGPLATRLALEQVPRTPPATAPCCRSCT